MITMMTMMRYYSFLALFMPQLKAFEIHPNRQNSAYDKAIIDTQRQETTLPPLMIPKDDLTLTPRIPCPLTSGTNDNIVRSLPKSRPGGVLSTSLRTRHYMNNVVDTMPITVPLTELGVTNILVPPRRNATGRTFVGLDDMPAEYWFDNRIHTFGNSGPWGGVHALMAPLATRIIDDAAYEGKNAREVVSDKLQHFFKHPNLCILDLCCGVGMSTRALSDTFKDAEFVLGIDTSPEMISMARTISKYQKILHILRNFQVRKNFITDLVKMIVDIQIALTSERQSDCNLVYARGNAERVNMPEKSFDLVTIMYAFHEIPKSARYRIIREARRLLKDGGILAVIDISEEYEPSQIMLAGEPYVLEYKKNFAQQVDKIQGFVNKEFTTIVPGHVNMWVLTRQK